MRAYFQPNESIEPANPEPDRVEDLEEDTMSSNSEMPPNHDQVLDVTGYESDTLNEDSKDTIGPGLDSPPANETASVQRPDSEEGSDEISETENVPIWKQRKLDVPVLKAHKEAWKKRKEILSSALQDIKKLI